jgi:hypothetical protein
MRINRTLLIAGLIIATASAASAQTAPSTNCTPTQASPQGTITPNDSATTGKSNEQLGDKLAKSDGVLCPPSNVDPAMRAPAPHSDSSNTPVIPPPGSPGGDQSIRPK